MLQATIKPHRAFLRADADTQKLFVMLKLLPSSEAAGARPRVNLALVIDTSGSMREPAPAVVDPTAPFIAPVEEATKLDLAMEAARRLVNSATLQPDDLVSLIQFDDNSRQLSRRGVRATTATACWRGSTGWRATVAAPGWAAGYGTRSRHCAGGTTRPARCCC